jgi:hypothetical protein
MVRTVTMLLLLLSLASDLEALCFQPARLAGDDPAYQYAATFIDALSYGKQASQRMSSTAPTQGSSESFLVAATRMLSDLELAAKDFECAASFMAGQESYAIDTSSDLAAKATRVAGKSATMVKSAYLRLAENARSMAGVVEEILAGRITMNQTPVRMAPIQTEAQEQWETVLYGVGPTTHLLVDPNPDASGYLSKLRITTAQRRDLVKRIDTAFGEVARKPPSEKTAPADATAAVLRQFLTGGHTDRGLAAPSR